jgi:hypothetical protein
MGWNLRRWWIGALVAVGFAIFSSAAPAAGIGWGAPLLVDPPASGDGPNGDILEAVSCASSSFCAAVDGSGYITMRNGHAWARPVHVDTTGDGLNSVSCPTVSFCVAVDAGGYETTFSGGRWSPMHDLDDQLYFESVSCHSPSFCVAVGDFGTPNSQALTFDGQTWSTPQTIDDSAGTVTGVSCPAASSCVAVDDAGNALTLDNGTWSAPAGIDSADTLDNVSCPSPSFCASNGRQIRPSGPEGALTFNGTRWSAPAAIDGAALDQTCVNSMVSPCTGLSCATASFCVAVNDLDHAVAWNGSSWSRPTPIDGQGRLVMSVSCVAGPFCVATDTDGYVTEYGPLAPAPALSGLRLSRDRLRASAGFLARYRDSAAGQTTLIVIAEVRGIRRGDECTPTSRATTRAHRCTYLLPVAYYTHQDTAGPNRVQLRSILRDGLNILSAPKLPIGSYLLQANATVGGRSSRTLREPFVVVR